MTPDTLRYIMPYKMVSSAMYSCSGKLVLISMLVRQLDGDIES